LGSIAGVRKKRDNVATILLVDDDPDIRRLLALALARYGHRCLVAENGEMALAKIAAENPDAVITDVTMPVMDGLELLRCLRADGHRDLPVVVYTAHAPDWVGYNSLVAGAQAIIHKPGSLRQIAETIQMLIDRRQRDVRLS
jgi:CheY-like chemotaxis protein